MRCRAPSNESNTPFPICSGPQLYQLVLPLIIQYGQPPPVLKIMIQLHVFLFDITKLFTSHEISKGINPTTLRMA